jgi:hypothetical protein
LITSVERLFRQATTAMRESAGDEQTADGAAMREQSRRSPDSAPAAAPPSAEPSRPLKGCGMCSGTGAVTRRFANQCAADGLAGICPPAGSRCYCMVTWDRIAAALPSVCAGILERSSDAGRSAE